MAYRPIPGYSRYEADESGNARRVSDGHSMTASSAAYGRRKFMLVDDAGRKRNVLVHRAVLSAFTEAQPPGVQVNHINGDPADNRLENLEWCTPSENMAHSYRIGMRSKQGEKHHLAKLTESDVRQIRALVADGALQREVAQRFAVGQDQISRIVSGKRWGHIEMAV